MKISTLFLACSLLLPSTLLAENKTVLGLNENAQLTELNLTLPAKLDTGAQTASLSAQDIQHFEKDNEPWVRFRLAIKGVDSAVLERPVARISKIKRRAGDYNPEQDGKSYTPRPVIDMEVCIGNRLRSIEVNLTDRSSFQYPFLIGSDALTRFGAIIDPSITYAAGKPDCTTNLATAAE